MKISKTDYDSYMKEIEQLMDLDPKKDTPCHSRLLLLAIACEDYEVNIFPEDDFMIRLKNRFLSF